MNIRQKIFFWLWVILVVGLILFGIIWIIVANVQAGADANNLVRIFSSLAFKGE